MRSSVLHHAPRPHLLMLGILAALAPFSPALAQSSGGTEAADLDTVTVTGIRGSLQSSMNLKRDSVGVMDGIIAEDIGKFPDGNLAESMQRISGVSIDRTTGGEGSRVTVRGISPDFNLVLLNGRQMPTANIGDNGVRINGSRAFDFANLASEAVSALQVYKTATADKPTGGIGATINIKTARPLDNPGFRATVGVKGVMDKASDRLPRTYPGSSMTPEISGLFSNTFADGRFGLAVNASYQERDSGYNQARVDRGWSVFRGEDGNNPNRLPLPSDSYYDEYDITHRPGAGDIYARPNNFMYLVSSEQRQRRNGQLTLQFAPIDNITSTLDYTYADNRVQRQRNELQAAFDSVAGASTWTDGPIAAPIIYSEYAPNADGVLETNGAEVLLRSELKSLGFNLEWQVNEHLDLAFDYHDSKSETLPDGPNGSANFIGTSMFIRGNTAVDFSTPLPILMLELAPGTSVDPAYAVLGTSGFRKGYSHSEIKQGQFSGTFRFADYQAIDFGFASTEANNRAASAEMFNVAANGLGTPADYDDDLWYVDNMGKYFRQFKGHNDPRLTDQFLVFDFNRLRERAVEFTGREALYRAPDDYDRDLRTVEKNRSAYLQWRNTFDWAVPVNVAAGVRYEKTQTDSPAEMLLPASNIAWVSTNGFEMTRSTDPVIGDFSGEYHHWLPSLDIRADLRDNLVLRGSFSKSIGRAGWEDIQGGLSVGVLTNRLGGSGNRGNPGLLPLESKNFDLSLEWYYGEGSYASVGYFRKKLSNFIGTTTTRETPFEIYTPIGGRYWGNAINLGGCGDNQLDCIRGYIFRMHDGDPGVDAANGIITGQPGDPLSEFEIRSPVNQRSDEVDGWEVSLQHMFGRSGFGVQLNYTKVDSGLTFDNFRLDDQYPMLGLSDSANLVLFYEQHGWQIRAAYNWRDEFLSSIGGAGPNPNYTESYGQLDVNVTWAMNEQLSFFVEGINLTDETQRIYARHKFMLRSASQTGPRYMFGARYKF